MGKRLISLISADKNLNLHSLRTLSSCLKQHGHQTRLVFLTTPQRKYHNRTLAGLRRLVSDSDLLGIYCNSEDTGKARQVICFLRTLEIPIVWLGPHATLAPELCIDEVDFVCIGEAEGAIPELANCLDDRDKIKTIKNLWIKEDDAIHKNELRPLISNLDDLPYEDYDFSNQFILKRNRWIRKFRKGYLGALQYRKFLLRQGLNGFSVSLSRGCPFRCFFCLNYDFQLLYGNATGSALRAKSVNAAIGELRYYKERVDHRFSFILFDDDDFFARPLPEIEEFSALYKGEVGFPFACRTHVQLFEEGKLKLLVNAGLRILDVGIYTVSEKPEKEPAEIDELCSKALEVAKILNKWHYIFFRPPIYRLINANPYESKDDTYKKIELIKAIPRPFIIQIVNLKFLPGSQLAKRALSNGILTKKESSALNVGNYNILLHSRKRRLLRYEWFLLSLLQGRHTSSKAGFISRRFFSILSSKVMVWFLERNMFLVRLLRIFAFLHPRSRRFVTRREKRFHVHKQGLLPNSK